MVPNHQIKTSSCLLWLASLYGLGLQVFLIGQRLQRGESHIFAELRLLLVPSGYD